MSKKKAKARVACLGCGSRMKARDVACRKCGCPRAGMAGKFAGGSAVAFLAKSAGSAWRCPCGHQLGKSATSCSSCGRIGGPGALRSTGQALKFLAKSAAGNQCARCLRVAKAEQRCCAGCGAQLPGRLRLATKSAAVPYLGDYRQESNPEMREFLWRRMHGQDGTTGGAA